MITCRKCGVEYDTECPWCAAIRAKFPDLIEYLDAVEEQKRRNDEYEAWEEQMGDDL